MSILIPDSVLRNWIPRQVIPLFMRVHCLKYMRPRESGKRGNGHRDRVRKCAVRRGGGLAGETLWRMQTEEGSCIRE